MDTRHSSRRKTHEPEGGDHCNRTCIRTSPGEIRQASQRSKFGVRTSRFRQGRMREDEKEWRGDRVCSTWLARIVEDYHEDECFLIS